MLRIVAMDLFPIRLALHDPIPMASGSIATCENVLVRLVSQDGVTGWGEGVEAPALTGQRQADILRDLESLRPVVLDGDHDSVAGLWQRLRSAAPEATTAIGAIDIAAHDLAANASGVPVHELLGGAVRRRVPALTLVGSGDTRADMEKLEKRWTGGYRWFKVKVGMAPPDVEWETLRAATSLVGHQGVVCADANEVWQAEEADNFLRGLDGSTVRFLEQPVTRDDPASLLALAERSPVPICADESAGTLDAVRGFGGTPVAGVSLKLIKHGGITGVMQGADICSRNGLQVNLAGKVIESSISAAANLHCAAAMESIEFGCSPANQGVVTDVTRSPIAVMNGEFMVPDRPGLGVEVDEDLVTGLSV
ncbi:MAG TPA: enolase C-terminal domain-like protein [Acidimicrobiia bacterium]|nr:enolase C-terminal domain-like protein [Acidimicrobiia bacterium]